MKIFVNGRDGLTMKKPVTFEELTKNLFVNRTKELSELREKLEKAASGEGTFVLINGEAGCGKSALLEHFKIYAEVSGAQYHLVHFSERVDTSPYASFQSLVDLLEVRDGPRFSSPSVKDTFKMSADKEEDITDGHFNLQKLQNLHNTHSLIQQRILSAILKSASEKPLVIVFEDVHLASQTTWQFIHYLSDKISEHRVLILTTLRQDGREISKEKLPVYSAILERMNRDGLINKINLDRFSRNNIRHLLRQIFKKTDFSSDLVPVLFNTSRGIPGQVLRYLRFLYDFNLIYQQNGVWFNVEHPDQNLVFKEMLEDLDVKSIVRKLKALPAKQLQILQYAALMNGPFSHSLMAVVNEGSKIELIRDLLRLENLKYLARTADDLFQFRRPEIQTALREQIPAEQRSQMHLKIAKVIIKTANISVNQKNYLLAYHYSHTNDYLSAFRYLEKAASQSINQYAFLEAKNYYDQAFSFLNAVSDEMDKFYLVFLRLQAAWLYRVLGFYESSLQHCNSAFDIYGRDTQDKITNLILIQQSFTYFRLNDWENAKANLERCLAFSDKMSLFEQSMVNYGLGNIYFETGDYSTARKCYEQGLSQARKAKGQSLVALILNNLGALENASGEAMRAISLYSQAIPIYRDLGDNAGLARVYNNIGMTHADARNWEQANQFYGKSLSVSDAMGLTPIKSITFLNRALALFHLNQFEQAQEYSFKAYRLLERLNDQLGMAEYFKIQALMKQREGQWDEAESYFNRAIEKFKKFNSQLGHAETCYERAMMEIERRRKPDAIAWFKEARQIFERMGLNKKVHSTDLKIRELEANEFVVEPAIE